MTEDGPRAGAPAWMRALLKLYPARFQAEFGDELQAAYRLQARRARTEGGWAAGWVLVLRTVVGMVLGATAEHRESWTRQGGGAMKKGMRTAWWSIELRQALRRLARSPIYALLCVGTLGVGAGAFGAVHSVVDTVLIEPMPYDRPEDLAWVWRDYTWADFPRGWLGAPDVLQLREESETIESVVAVRSGRFNLAGPSGLEPREIRSIQASADLFETLGVQPVMGRGFLPGEDEPGAEPVVVLRHELWSSTFGSDPAVLGSTIYLDGQAATVVGVLPEGFDFVMHSSLGSPLPADLYRPLQLDLLQYDAGSGFLAGLVRFRSDASTTARDGALSRVSSELDASFRNQGLRLWAVGMRDDLVASIRAPLWTILGAAAFLLLTLSTNLAALFMARVAGQERDVAVRSSLGASRSVLATSLVAEVAAVAVVGAVLGGMLATWGSAFLAQVAADTLPRATEIAVGVTGWTITALLAGLVAAGAAGLPVARVLRMDAGSTLRESGARSGGSKRRIRARSALVVAQVSLSMVLLVSAGLLARTVVSLLRVDPGFDPSSTLVFKVAPDVASYPELADHIRFREELRAGLERIPGVTAVGVANQLPLGQQTDQSNASFPGAPGNIGDESADAPLTDLFSVGQGYFEAVGFRLMEGRAFGAGDSDGVAIIDEVLAARFYPSGGALGSTVVSGGDTMTVVGIVDQPRLYTVNEDDRGQLYFPYAGPSGA